MNKKDSTNKKVESTKEDFEKEKVTFLYKAIEDAQETIRLTDRKTSIILLLVIIFVSAMGTHLPDIAKYFWDMKLQFQIVLVTTFLLFIVCTGITILLMIRVIFPKSNPLEHIVMEYKPRGLFYLQDLNMKWKDYFIDRKELILRPSFEEYMLKLQAIEDTKTIQKELTYELLKVSFIKEMKIRRLGNIRKWIIGSLILSLIIFCFHFMGLSYYMPVSHNNEAHFPEFIIHLFK